MGMFEPDGRGRVDPSVPCRLVLAARLRSGSRSSGRPGIRRRVPGAPVARLRTVRTRLFELRLLAIALTVAWAAAAGLVLVAYRPGGPLDVLVGIAMLVPILIAMAAVQWPPVTRGATAFPLMVILGTVSLLLLLPSIGGIVLQIQALGSQTLMPSVEAAYPWVLALAGTSLFAAFGLARRLDGASAVRPRRLALGVAIGIGLTALAGGAFAAVTIANEIALRDSGAVARASRFGPVADGDLPTCDAPFRVGPTARVAMQLHGEIDGRSIGTVDLDGLRSGEAFRWLAYVATGRELGLHGQAWTEGRAFVRSAFSEWRQSGSVLAAGGSLDLWAAETVLSDAYLATAEDRGEEVLEGARARRCRISIDGGAFAAAFPQVRFLVDDADLSRWRGQLDYWVFLDGQLGQVAGSINGDAFEIASDALQGTLTVHLTATERDRDIVIYPPLP
jgi:hypothetical protein